MLITSIFLGIINIIDILFLVGPTVDLPLLVLATIMFITSVNYWRYPIKGWRLTTDIITATVGIFVLINNGVLTRGLAIAIPFCLAILCFFLGNYAWRPHSTESYPPSILTPYWSYLHVAFHMLMFLSFNAMIHDRAKENYVNIYGLVTGSYLIVIAFLIELSC
ncbi:MAG: hypothetical protein CMA27_02985 [Euryarchaeota archaeon]|nr:hypothetical protein [Euryarchaeota archaeon]